MKPVKILYRGEDWGSAQVDGFAFSRPQQQSLGTVFGGFVAGAGMPAQATMMILDDLKGLRFMMLMRSIEWGHLAFEIDKVLYQLIKYTSEEGNTLNECRFLMIGPLQQQ